MCRPRTRIPSRELREMARRKAKYKEQQLLKRVELRQQRKLLKTQAADTQKQAEEKEVEEDSLSGEEEEEESEADEKSEEEKKVNEGGAPEKKNMFSALLSGLGAGGVGGKSARNSSIRHRFNLGIAAFIAPQGLFK